MLTVAWSSKKIKWLLSQYNSDFTLKDTTKRLVTLQKVISVHESVD